MEEAVQCSQRRVCDEIKLEAMQHVQLITQHTLAVLPDQAAELVRTNVCLLDLHLRSFMSLLLREEARAKHRLLDAHPAAVHVHACLGKHGHVMQYLNNKIALPMHDEPLQK